VKCHKYFKKRLQRFLVNIMQNFIHASFFCRLDEKDNTIVGSGFQTKEAEFCFWEGLFSNPDLSPR